MLNVGGVLEQYDRPADLLRAPANAFVESFLGRERALRRMALLTVADASPGRGPVVPADATAAEAREVMAAHRVDWVAVLEGDRLRGWVDERDLQPQGSVGTAGARPFAAQVATTTPLREALAWPAGPGDIARP